MEILKEDSDFVYVKQVITKIHKKRKRYVDPDGYVKVFVGYDYPGSFRGYMREHVYKMENHVKRELTKYEVVHHRDGNKQNNEISNLEIINTRDHGTFHHPRFKVRFKHLYPNTVK